MDPVTSWIHCGVLEVVLGTPTLLRSDPQRTLFDPTCTDRSTRDTQITRFLESVPTSIRADFLDVRKWWSRDRDTAGQTINDVTTRLRYDLKHVAPSPRRQDLTRLLQLLQAQRHAAILLTGWVKAGGDYGSA
jgi:hypothetical protein